MRTDTGEMNNLCGDAVGGQDEHWRCEPLGDVLSLDYQHVKILPTSVAPTRDAEVKHLRHSSNKSRSLVLMM